MLQHTIHLILGPCIPFLRPLSSYHHAQKHNYKRSHKHKKHLSIRHFQTIIFLLIYIDSIRAIISWNLNILKNITTEIDAQFALGGSSLKNQSIAITMTSFIIMCTTNSTPIYQVTGMCIRMFGTTLQLQSWSDHTSIDKKFHQLTNTIN